MSVTLEPRKVEKPFLFRWVRSTCLLILASPVTFVAVIALLALLHLTASELASMPLIEHTGVILAVGLLLLPVLWIALSVLARRSDRPMSHSELRAQLLGARVWGGGLLPGCLLACASWLVRWALARSGAVADVVGSNIWNTLLIVVPLGVCYCPLMGLAPGLSVADACLLSRAASRMNDGWVIVLFVAILSLIADGLQRAGVQPGLVGASFLVFIGVFSYVAYRDIFERRVDYAPQPVVARLRKAVPAGRAYPLPLKRKTF